MATNIVLGCFGVFLFPYFLPIPKTLKSMLKGNSVTTYMTVLGYLVLRDIILSPTGNLRSRANIGKSSYRKYRLHYPENGRNQKEKCI